MLSYSRSHLADHLLVRTLAAVVTQDRTTTAEMLALIAEVDKRGLFRDAGYPSMYRYCLGKFGMSEDMAYKRIVAARVARRLPSIFAVVAEGRLSLSVIVTLKRFLTGPDAEELLAAASGMTRAEAELWMAQRFPKPDVPATLVPVAGTAAPGPTPSPREDLLDSSPKAEAPAQVIANTKPLPAPGRVLLAESQSVAAQAAPSAPQRRAAPLSPGRYELRLTISQELHDKLTRAQDLLGHAVPSGDYAEILERALDELIAKQEKRKFAATAKPRAVRRSSKNPRHIPAEMKRSVRLRDQGRCTYVSDDGHRCESRNRLEYDHEQPLARGGKTCVANLRLRCRAHNQLEAERAFGAGFMDEKRGRVHPHGSAQAP